MNYETAMILFSPSIDSDERLNAGVVMLTEKPSLISLMPQVSARVMAAFPDFNPETYMACVNAYEALIDDARRSTLGVNSFKVIMEDVLANFSCFTLGKIGVGDIENPFAYAIDLFKTKV